MLPVKAVTKTPVPPAVGLNQQVKPAFIGQLAGLLLGLGFANVGIGMVGVGISGKDTGNAGTQAWRGLGGFCWYLSFGRGQIPTEVPTESRRFGATR